MSLEDQVKKFTETVRNAVPEFVFSRINYDFCSTENFLTDLTLSFNLDLHRTLCDSYWNGLGIYLNTVRCKREHKLLGTYVREFKRGEFRRFYPLEWAPVDRRHRLRGDKEVELHPQQTIDILIEQRDYPDVCLIEAGPGAYWVLEDFNCAKELFIPRLKAYLAAWVRTGLKRPYGPQAGFVCQDYGKTAIEEAAEKRGLIEEAKELWEQATQLVTAVEVLHE